MSDLHYRIYRTKDAYKVVCVQWFDLPDYDERRWVKNEHGDPLEFDTEGEAIERLADMVGKPKWRYEAVDAFFCREHEDIHVGEIGNWSDSHFGYMDRLYRKVLDANIPNDYDETRKEGD